MVLTCLRGMQFYLLPDKPRKREVIGDGSSSPGEEEDLEGGGGRDDYEYEGGCREPNKTLLPRARPTLSGQRRAVKQRTLMSRRIEEARDHVAGKGRQHPPKVNNTKEEAHGIPRHGDDKDHDDPPDPPMQLPHKGTPPSIPSTLFLSRDAELPPSGRITRQRDSPRRVSSDRGGDLA